MKTFKILKEELIQILLNENRIEFLKNQYKSINIGHDPYGKFKDSSDIIDHFANTADPTKNKKYLQWILKRYNEGNIRQEDHPRIKTALTEFEKHTLNNNIKNKDINKYKTLGEVEDEVDKHKEIKSGKEIKQEIKNEGAELIHSENGLTVHHIKTKEAACLYGRNTKWCTAATDGMNMFDHYNEQGKIYIINTPEKDLNGNNKKYQFHFESDQFMNEKDEPIDLGELIKKHPQLMNVEEFQGKHWELTKDKNDFIDRNINKFNQHHLHQYIDHPEIYEINENSKNKLRKLNDDFERVTMSNDSKELDRYKHHYNDMIRVLVAGNPNTHPNTLHDMRNDSDKDVRWNIVSNNNTHPDTLHEIAKNKDSTIAIKQKIVNRDNTRSDTLDHISNDKKYLDVFSTNLLLHPNISESTFEKILPHVINDSNVFRLNKNKDTIKNINNRNKLNESLDIINGLHSGEKTLFDYSYNTRKKHMDLLTNYNRTIPFKSHEITPEILEHFHNHESSIIRSEVAEYSKSPELLDKMKHDKDRGVRNSIITNENVHPDTLHEMRNDNDPINAYYIAQHYKAHEKTIRDMYENHKNKNSEFSKSVITGLSENPNLPSDIADELSHHEDKNIKIALLYKNNNLSDDALLRLSKDDNESVRRLANTHIRKRQGY